MASRGNNGSFLKAGAKRCLENLMAGVSLGKNREKESEMIEKGDGKSEITDNVKWNEGRRVVDLAVLAEGLQECSSIVCCLPLHLKDTECETRIGLGSMLWVRCECGELNRVNTSERHGKKKGTPSYDVNTKLASGLIHSGVSFVAGQRLFEALEIPPPTYNCIKRRESEV